MKKKNIIYWAVALVLVLVTAYSTVHVHNARQVNDVKMQSESRKQAEEDAQQKRLLADQKKRLIKPASWDKPTLSGGYPDISKYAHAKRRKNVSGSRSTCASSVFISEEGRTRSIRCTHPLVKITGKPKLSVHADRTFQN